MQGDKVSNETKEGAVERFVKGLTRKNKVKEYQASVWGQNSNKNLASKIPILPVTKLNWPHDISPTLATVSTDRWRRAWRKLPFRDPPLLLLNLPCFSLTEILRVIMISGGSLHTGAEKVLLLKCDEGSCRACLSVTDLATKATLLDDWMLDFLIEFWFEPLTWYSLRKLVNWVYDDLIMWRRWH